MNLKDALKRRPLYNQNSTRQQRPILRAASIDCMTNSIERMSCKLLGSVFGVTVVRPVPMD